MHSKGEEKSTYRIRIAIANVQYEKDSTLTSRTAARRHCSTVHNPFFPIEGFTHNTEMHSHFYRTSEELYAETRSNFLISQCTESNVTLFGFTVNNLLVILDI